MSYYTATVKLSGASNTTRDATGSNVYELVQATQNCYVDRLLFQSLGTNVATVARVFINVADPTTLAGNNFLHNEVTLPVTTATEVAAVTRIELDMDIYLRTGQRLLLTVGTAIAAGYDVSAIMVSNYRDLNV